MALEHPTFEKLPRFAEEDGLTKSSVFVTRRQGEKTSCHDNFGYYFCKQLIPCAAMPGRVGIPYALRSKLVDS